MKTNLEIEYKTLITLTDHQNIMNYFDFSEPTIQTNVYFDTENEDLLKLQMMCRVRVINDHFEFTLKVPQDDGVLEYELELNSLSLNDQRLLELFQKFDINAFNLNETTRSITSRRTFIDLYGEWCLDETQFECHKDYEIEYELHGSNEKAYPHFQDTLNRLNIEATKATPKYIRALNSCR